MEALLTTRFHAATLSHSSSPRGTHVDLSLCRHRVRFLGNSPSRAPVIPPLRVSSESHPKDHVDWHWESDTVDVIGIGSRKDAVIDFCLESPFASSSHLRFWTICSRDSQKVQLLQRSHGKDMVLRNVELPLSVRPCPPAVILVASAGHGTEHITAIELLNAFRSEGGLAVSILLKPFSFEGKRRQLEVDYLANMLQECSQLRIVVETDSILEKEVETLEEALKSVNNAVLMAVNMVYVLTSERYLKFLDAPHEQVKELKFMEALELFGGHGETNVGFGAGYNFKSSFAQAIFHCPFINGGLKDFKGIVVLMLARACRTYEKELPYIIQTFRLITECTGEIILSGVHEPDLEPNLIVTTILLVGCNEQKTSQRKSFLSVLALHFPFFFSFLGRDSSEQNDNLSTYSPTNSSISSNDGSKQSLNLVDGVFEDLDLYADKQETEACSKTSNNENKSSKVGFSWSSYQSFYHGCHQTDKEHVEQLRNGGAGPGFQIAQQWSEERSSLSIENSAVFTLPVGVKSSRQRTDINHIYDNASDPEILDDMSSETLSSPEFPPGDAPTNVGFEAVTDFCNSAFSPIKGKNADLSRKQGLLSVRAASMLEAERETQKKWTPIMEMQYRGGIYWGRCQGGLPEGKGRLALIDGSSYDGMWHCGKRSGLGTFFYSNGDVFQGSWRDDCMHGKGWFYFHTGDRWFANFWKGKANGEGRFYSKSGSIFFGNFHNGWRHGKSLFIDASGSRWTEIWEEGVLVSHSELGSQLSD